MNDRPLGRKQLKLLMAFGNPGRVATGFAFSETERVAESLLQRDMLAPGPSDLGWRITPAGLRRLADELEAGRLDDWIER